ncbi:osteoclast stimulatory transmembrane protein-like [Brachyhypopomus gauderio]|uniref:osteoclast stimulatory transmembrane protein-like n=1 Tax=Brachyhypopomus gauderio TaxID=698409 RepID=UPI004041E076
MSGPRHFTKGHLSQLRLSLLSAKQRMALIMGFAWNAYCKPCPSDGYEMITLIFLCVLISSMVSALLFVWMAFNLAYSLPVGAIVTGVCACVMSLLLILVHPVRCVVTMAVPSLGTKQGQKILLSMALFYTISTCVPNMTHNIVSLLHTLKCGAGNATQDVLQSINMPYNAMSDIKNFLKDLSPVYHSSAELHLENTVDLQSFKRTISNASEDMRARFTLLNHNIHLISHISKKLIAALFMLLLAGSSVRYVNGYLTHIRYDNIYCSQQLLKALKRASGDDSLPENYRKKLVKTLGVHMNRRELQRCLWGALVILFYALMCGIVLGLDYFVYRTLQMLLSQTSDAPAVKFTLFVNMEIKITAIKFVNVETKRFDKEYPYTVEMLPQGCVHTLRSPQRSTLVTVCVSLVVGFFLLMGEVFARRVRRKVCASFYRNREEQRTKHLLLKILKKRETSEP